MASDALYNSLLDKLKTYKKKYYTNVLLKGLILFFAILFSTYIFFSFLEYFGRFNSTLRLIIFFCFLSIAIFSLVRWVIQPIIKLFTLNKQLSDEEAALQIGRYFPEVGDKLINTLQLKHLDNNLNELIEASISQRTKQLNVFSFAEAIHYTDNKKYIKYVAGPIAIILTVLFFLPHVFVESTARIINYDKNYAYPAPFEFQIVNKDLTTYKNEDFDVRLNLKGNAMPEAVYLISNGKRTKMKKEYLNHFTFKFKDLQKSEKFFFEAAGFNSQNFKINVINRPTLLEFYANLSYPSYVKKKNEKVKNAGNLIVPQGTVISWNFLTSFTNQLTVKFNDIEKEKLTESQGHFQLNKKILKSENYEIELENQFGKSPEMLKYYINVLPDEFPKLNADQLKDTILYKNINISGSISDDYGLSKLNLFYRVKGNDNSTFKAITIKIDPSYPTQNFYYAWQLDSIHLNPDEKLEYYLQVWDNDGVNGSKSTKSSIYEFKLPSQKEIEKELEANSQQAESKMSDMQKKASEIEKEINSLEKKLKTKADLNWQDKKNIEEILKSHNELKKQLDELKHFNEQQKEKQEKFKDQSPELSQKIEQLQQLMNELLDEETKKLYEELQKMLNENQNKDDIQKVLEEIKKKEDTFEKEMDRALEMFKQLKFDTKLEETIKELKEQAKKQEELAEKSMEKDAPLEKIQEEQKKLNEDFKETQKDLKDLEEINKSLENKHDLENTEKQEEEISKEQQKSSEELGDKQKKKAGDSQKKAAEKMEKLSEDLAKMKQSNEMEEMQENIDDLRNILENLLTLSFDQEDLMKEFKKVNQTDPRFITLSQKQLKLKDDSQVIEDSLLALAKRVFQLQSYITKEVTEVKNNIDESVSALKDRRLDIATGKQQFAMTSINNLALLLNDALKQMQQQMADAMKSGGSPMCKKPGGKKPSPGMGELQKQLNQKIADLQKSGKTGKGLSEELAKLAAQQEAIRKALKEMSKGEKPGGRQGLNKLGQQMEETETDLVNKKITQETILRQKEILTRLLEAEKAARERELDDKREAESAKEKQNDLPPSFDKYFKAKEKQIDLLKTVPLGLTPYYKKEVNEYFHNIEK